MPPIVTTGLAFELPTNKRLGTGDDLLPIHVQLRGPAGSPPARTSAATSVWPPPL
jgi:hypothetical protein